jgi:hypothetical protein
MRILDAKTMRRFKKGFKNPKKDFWAKRCYRDKWIKKNGIANLTPCQNKDILELREFIK